MDHNLVARASVTVDASRSETWSALISPEAIRQYMFGTTVISSWEEGSPITWRGEWKGKSYEDKGRILEVSPEERLQYTHYSPLSGLSDEPENHHTITIELSDDGDGTRIDLMQDNNPNEEARKHSEENWQAMLAALKKYLED